MQDAPSSITDPAKDRRLRRGWTTGACATAAVRAAFEALITGTFPDPVEITLPKGQRVAFTLAVSDQRANSAMAGIIKDAGDDPDVTHGVLIEATVAFGPEGSGVTFHAGKGVGRVTKPGLPIAPGEPAINPVPRRMMQAAVADAAAMLGVAGDVAITISVPNGEAIAAKTMNPRLGILGGISILGTTGIVTPYSCSAWIHSIHRGIDIARATGLTHIAGATGSTSERSVQAFYGLPEAALIDMGDFVGGMLKYVHRHPVPRVTIAGGFAKMTKLAQGLLDLHSARGSVDFNWMHALLTKHNAPEALLNLCAEANTALQVLKKAEAENFDVGNFVADAARRTALGVLGDAPVTLDVLVFDRDGRCVGRAPKALVL